MPPLAQVAISGNKRGRSSWSDEQNGLKLIASGAISTADLLEYRQQ